MLGMWTRFDDCDKSGGLGLNIYELNRIVGFACFLLDGFCGGDRRWEGGDSLKN